MVRILARFMKILCRWCNCWHLFWFCGSFILCVCLFNSIVGVLGVCWLVGFLFGCFFNCCMFVCLFVERGGIFCSEGSVDIMKVQIPGHECGKVWTSMNRPWCVFDDYVVKSLRFSVKNQTMKHFVSSCLLRPDEMLLPISSPVTFNPSPLGHLFRKTTDVHSFPCFVLKNRKSWGDEKKT